MTTAFTIVGAYVLIAFTTLGVMGLVAILVGYYSGRRSRKNKITGKRHWID